MFIGLWEDVGAPGGNLSKPGANIQAPLQKVLDPTEDSNPNQHWAQSTIEMMRLSSHFKVFIWNTVASRVMTCSSVERHSSHIFTVY